MEAYIDMRFGAGADIILRIKLHFYDIFLKVLSHALLSVDSLWSQQHHHCLTSLLFPAFEPQLVKESSQSVAMPRRTAQIIKS